MWQSLFGLFGAPEASQVQRFVDPSPSPAAEPAASTLQLHDAALVAVADSLRELGLEWDGLQVPQIAVVGVQSSGKSSVLESLTKIPFPRDSTTCTRGPIEVRLKPCRDGSEEKIRVYRHRAGGVAMDFDVPDGVEEFELAQESSPEFAEHIQKLIADMLEEGPGTQGPSKFTDDVLVVEVYRRAQIPFTVVDLPGYFQCTNSNDAIQAQDKRKVHGMIDQFIRSPATLIMHVIPANVDPLTLESWKECNKHDRLHQRTIGVLTKFDVAGEEYRDQWVRRITTQRDVDDFAYPLGMYVLRCRSAEETKQGVTWEQMRAIEARAVSAWLSEQHMATRHELSKFMGVENLTRCLNHTLGVMIRKSLPNIQAGVEEKVEETQQLLAQLGEPVTNAATRRKLLIKVQKHIKTTLSNLLDGEPLKDLLSTDIRPALAQLERQVALDDKSFVFILNQVEDQLIEHVSELATETVLDATQTTQEGAVPSTLKIERNARMRLDVMPEHLLDDGVVAVDLEYDGGARQSHTEEPQLSIRFSPDWVHEVENMIMNRKAHRMDGFMEFKVFQHIVQKLVNESRRNVDGHIDRMTHFFRELVTRVPQPPASQYLANHAEPGVTATTNSAERGIYAHLQQLLLERFEDVMREVRTEVDKLFENELHPRSRPTHAQRAQHAQHAGEHVVEAPRKRKRDDGEATEAEQMLLRVHQHWTVARVRLVDNICMTIRRVFLTNFLEQQALDVLQEVDDDTLAEIAQEDNETRLMRRRLLQRLERYQEAMQTVQQASV